MRVLTAVLLTAACLAHVLGMSLEQLTETLWANTQRLGWVSEAALV